MLLGFIRLLELDRSYQTLFHHLFLIQYLHIYMVNMMVAILVHSYSDFVHKQSSLIHYSGTGYLTPVTPLHLMNHCYVYLNILMVYPHYPNYPLRLVYSADSPELFPSTCKNCSYLYCLYEIKFLFLILYVLSLTVVC